MTADFFARLLQKISKSRHLAEIDLKIPVLILIGYFGFAYVIGRTPFASSAYRFAFPQLFFLGALAVVFLRTKLTLADVGFSKQHLGQNIWLGIATGLVPNFLIASAGLFIYLFGEDVVGDAAQMARGWINVVQVICLLVFAPLLEEILFRGLLFNALQKSHSLVAATFISAIVFMGAHLTFHPGALILGIFTAFLFHLTGSIVPSILLHSLSNLSGLLLVHFFPSVLYLFQSFYR